jgi:hypothetical protein
MVPLHRLGTADGPGSAPGVPLAVKVDGRGRFWVLFSLQLPVVFDASGRFLAELGSRGAGPGEFLAPVGLVMLPGDSVLVLDVDNARATLVTPSLEIGRSIRLPGPLSDGVATEWPARVLMTGDVRTPERPGMPLHEVNMSATTAEIARSLVSGPAELRPGPAAAVHQRLSSLKSSGVWFFDPLRYRVARWTSTGALTEDLERTPSWFPSPSRPTIGSPDVPPAPFVDAVEEDDTGLLWVFSRVAAPGWRSAWARLPVNLRGAREIMEVSSRGV